MIRITKTTGLVPVVLTETLVFGNQVFFDHWSQLQWSAFLRAAGGTNSASSFFHKAIGSLFLCFQQKTDIKIFAICG